MIATILDTKTGKTRVAPGWSSFWWAEGSGSCDCNRELGFVKQSEAGNCLGCRRYLIIRATFDDEERRYTLRELNAGYPEALLAKLP
jgi:hypothetical protein